ncbi:transcriptional regulator [Embleya sp. NPDC050493]|uniref:transcriptional regulator n=1 Tax=Embleya sp. NPDC050493 TaxID=3363989 RepID=UPI0037B64BB9
MAAAQGYSTSCDHTSVARWLDGSVPRDPVPELLAQVFSQQTGRLLKPQDLDMDSCADEISIGLRYPRTLENTVETVTRLWRYDLERRKFLVGSAFVSGAASVSSRDWLIGNSQDRLAVVGSGTNVCMEDVRQIRALGDQFERLSHEFGAQRIRRHMTNFLNYDVRPLLGLPRTEEVGKELFRTAAEFTAAAGYMALDCNDLGLAERYHITALRLSQAADDRGFGAYMLAAHMGHLALYAGHPDEAVQLAQASRESRRHRAEPLAVTISWIVEARGRARMGDRPGCLRALSRAESSFPTSNGSRDFFAPYLRYFDEAYLADAFAHCFRDLDCPELASRYAHEALRGLPSSYVRRASINTAIVAGASLDKGEPDKGAKEALEAVRLTSKLYSPRAVRRIATLRRRFEPYSQVDGVRQFLVEADRVTETATS